MRKKKQKEKTKTNEIVKENETNTNRKKQKKIFNTKTVTIQNKRQATMPNQQEKGREHENNELERISNQITLTFRIYFRI